MVLMWILLFLLLVGPLIVLIIFPLVVRTGTGTTKRRLTILRAMRAASVSILAILLLIGIALVVLGILTVNESRSIETGDDAFAAFGIGFLVAVIGSLLCLVGGLGLWAWSRRTSHEMAGSTFERRGNDTHCKKCGSELIGPGGPCRRCDNVQTRPCASCGRYILPNDKTCQYCGADQR